MPILDERPEVEAEPLILRSRALKVIGGAVFGVASGLLFRSEPAFAQHEGPLTPCYGYPRCHYCDGGYCWKYCWWPHQGGHCPSGIQYWEQCYNGTRWRCRDWHEQFPGYLEHHCVCRGSLGGC